MVLRSVATQNDCTSAAGSLAAAAGGGAGGASFLQPARASASAPTLASRFTRLHIEDDRRFARRFDGDDASIRDPLLSFVLGATHPQFVLTTLDGAELEPAAGLAGGLVAAADRVGVRGVGQGQ